MAGNRYEPSASVIAVRTPCIDGLEIVTVTPGITPPVASDTLPLIAPVVAPTDCANAGTPASTTRHIIPVRIRTRLMVTPSVPHGGRAQRQKGIRPGTLRRRCRKARKRPRWYEKLVVTAKPYTG